MQDHLVLGQVALGYTPIIDRRRAVIATRLTIFPERPDAAPDAAALLRAIGDAFCDAAGATAAQATPRPLDPAAVDRRAAGTPMPLSLNLVGEGLLRGVMAAAPGARAMVEVPAFMAADAECAAALRSLHAAGTVLIVKGRPLAPLAPEIVALFSHAIVEPGEDRRQSAAPQPGVRSVSTVQAGVRSGAETDAAFQRGAVAVVGWPWDEEPPPPAGRGSVPSDVKVVLELVDGVERELPVPRLEAVLRRDPTLAFRLLRYLNSPAFGLAVEVNSFGHALMMLGYGRLKRWLALLLASSAKGPNAKPLLYAAVRRGLLMEALAPEAPADAEMRGEMFICGVFSLLDRLLQQPFAELLPNVPVPDRVQQALRGAGGPYLPYLELVRAIEHESLYDMRELSDSLLLSPAGVNRAVLAALHAARQLDG